MEWLGIARRDAGEDLETVKNEVNSWFYNGCGQGTEDELGRKSNGNANGSVRRLRSPNVVTLTRFSFPNLTTISLNCS